MNKLLWLFLLSILVFGTQCAKTPNAQDACGYVQNADGQRISWKGQFPIQLYFDPNFPPQFYQAVQNSIATWEKGIGHHVFDLVGTLSGTQPSRDGKSVIYWMTSWDSNSPNQQANTTIHWLGDQLVEADIQVNAKNFTYSTNPVNDQVDIESIMTHELGHALGLKHDDPTPSVMDKSLPSAYLRRDLYPADLTSLKCEY